MEPTVVATMKGVPARHVGEREAAVTGQYVVTGANLAKRKVKNTTHRTKLKCPYCQRSLWEIRGYRGLRMARVASEDPRLIHIIPSTHVVLTCVKKHQFTTAVAGLEYEKTPRKKATSRHGVGTKQGPVTPSASAAK